MTRKMRAYFVATYERGIDGALRAEHVRGLTHLYRVICEMVQFLEDEDHQIVIRKERGPRSPEELPTIAQVARVYHGTKTISERIRDGEVRVER